MVIWIIRQSKTIGKAFFVLVGIIVVTSVSIDATDTFSTSQSALGILATFATAPACATDSAPLQTESGTLCVDLYEASVGDKCLVKNPASLLDTAVNANDSDCRPLSQPAMLPWRQVTHAQATQLCARAGKRLLTVLEWSKAAAGTPDNATVCALKENLRPSGQDSRCVSGMGAFDMVGNVWELVAGTVVAGNLEETALPPSGYVTAISADSWPSNTGSSSSIVYNKDYFWSEATGTYVILRGGFYGSGLDGGLYSAHADIAADFASAAVGFRCARQLAGQ